MLQAADKYQSIVKQQYDIIQDRFNDGMISRTDLLMISTRLKEAELQYIKARQNYTLALQKLNILMGEEPNNPVDSLYTIDTTSGSGADPFSGECTATSRGLRKYGSEYHEKSGATQSGS